MKKLAYCGDRCDLCPRFRATQSDSPEDWKQARDIIAKVGWASPSCRPGGMGCGGCEDILNCEYGVKECCIERAIPNCGHCPEYPCARIEKVFRTTESREKQFQKFLTPEEYALLEKAFMEKRAAKWEGK